MRKCITIISGCILLSGLTALSQSPSEEYNQFRQQILNDYDNFKSRILEHYDDFLNGEWHEFEPIMEAESPYSEPKPSELPVIDESTPLPEEQPMVQMPTPKFSPNSLPGLNAAIPGDALAEGGPDLSRSGIEALHIDVDNLSGLSLPKTSGNLSGGLAMGGPDLSKTGSERMRIDVPEMGGATGPKTSGKLGGTLAKGGPDQSKTASERMRISVSGFGGSSISSGAVSPTTAAFIKKELEGKSNYAKALMRLPDPEFAFGSLPGQIAAPNPGESGIIAIDMSGRIAEDAKNRLLAGSGYATEDTFKEPENEDVFRFDFYGMQAFLPEIDFSIASSVPSPLETGAHWKQMAGQEGGMETARQLFGLAQQLGLNGYLTFRLAEQYANQRFKESDANARMSAVHFLMNQMGYDMRLVRYDDVFTVMMPFDQEVVYGTQSIRENNGRKYTLLFPEGYEPKPGQHKFATGSLPSNAKGKTSDLRLTGLSLPVKAKEFSVSSGGITVKGEVNENLKKMFYHYPQMPYGDFASSWIDQPLRESLVAQVREQLAGKTQKEAINSLMAFFHKGFPYKSDQDWHIFEKPYFLEENFLYEYNDCEDRAIFMTYLVWNALGLPCQLIQYPGHESVTVAVTEPVTGSYYNTDGVKYFSADPTFIGSNLGMVMTAYQNASPTIDKHYK